MPAPITANLKWRHRGLPQSVTAAAAGPTRPARSARPTSKYRLACERVADASHSATHDGLGGRTPAGTLRAQLVGRLRRPTTDDRGPPAAGSGRRRSTGCRSQRCTAPSTPTWTESRYGRRSSPSAIAGPPPTPAGPARGGARRSARCGQTAPRAASGWPTRSYVEVRTAREWLRIGQQIETARRSTEPWATVDCRTARCGRSRAADAVERARARPSLAESLPVARRTRSPTGRSARDAGRDRGPAARSSTLVATDPDGMVAGFFDSLRRMRSAHAVDRRRARPVAATARRVRGRAERWPSIAQQRADALATPDEGWIGPPHELVLHVAATAAPSTTGRPSSERRRADRAHVVPAARSTTRRASDQRVGDGVIPRAPATSSRRHASASSADHGVRSSSTTTPTFEDSGHTVDRRAPVACWTCHRRRHAPSATARVEEPGEADLVARRVVDVEVALAPRRVARRHLGRDPAATRRRAWRRRRRPRRSPGPRSRRRARASGSSCRLRKPAPARNVVNGASGPPTTARNPTAS